MKKIVLILPAYNAAKTLKPFLAKVPKNIFDAVILVDDNSADNTYNMAKKYKGIKAYKNIKNLGYGGNVKKCLSLALKDKADVIIEIHPDGEYGFDGIIPALEKVKNGSSFVLGNRFDKNIKATGMLWWKYPATRILTFIDNLVLGADIKDMHQGFRVYTRKLLEETNWRLGSNDFIFSFEIIAQAAFKNIKIESVPVSTRYSGIKRGATAKASIVYTLKTFWTLALFFMAKLGIRNPLFS